jgi:hypothetical protein
MEEEVPNEGSERDTLALILVAAECRPTCGRGKAALSCSHTTPLIGDIGSSRQDFSEFCRSPSLQLQTPLIGDIGSSRQDFSEFCLSPSLQLQTPSIGGIGNSRQNFSEFCRSPSWRFENRSFHRLFLLFEIPVKIKKKVRNCQWVPRFCPWAQSIAAGSWRGKCRAQWEDLDGTCGRRIKHDELG